MRRKKRKMTIPVNKRVLPLTQMKMTRNLMQKSTTLKLLRMKKVLKRKLQQS